MTFHSYPALKHRAKLGHASGALIPDMATLHRSTCVTTKCQLGSGRRPAVAAARISNQAEAASFCNRTGNGLILGNLFFWAFQRS